MSLKHRIRYYRIAYHWGRSMDFGRLRSARVAREGWRRGIFIPIPDPPPPEAIELGRELARKHNW